MPAPAERDYSHIPLPRKLGIREGSRVTVVAEGLAHAVPAGQDVIVFFATSFDEVERRFTRLAAKLTPAGGLWIAYPKRASGIRSDLSENGLRDIGLPAGLVDNKICSIDDRWSGIRFVTRVQDRPPMKKR